MRKRILDALQKASAPNRDDKSIIRLYSLEIGRKKALRNARTQKKRAELRLNTRVSHTFWEQVAKDYDREINRLIFNSGKLFKFNVNDHILVKLTESGKSHWKKEFLKYASKDYTFEEHFGKYTREDGYTSFQLWNFMELFGPVTHHASDHFETTVYFRQNELTSI